MKTSVKLIVFAVCLLLTTSCSSRNSVITRVHNKFTGESEQYSPKDDSMGNYVPRAERLLNKNLERIRMVFLKDYAPVYPTSKFVSDFKKTSSGIELNLEWESPKALFPLGEYDLARTKVHNKREALSFIDFLSDNIRKTIDDLDEAGLTGKYTVVAKITGQADATPIVGRLTYLGEYGDEIVMPKNNTTLNGRPHSFVINKSQRINNEELAALRAYSILSYLEGGFYRVPIDKFFNVNVATNRGQAFRTASVKVSVKEK